MKPSRPQLHLWLLPVAAVGTVLLLFGASAAARATYESIPLGETGAFRLLQSVSVLALALLTLPVIVAELLCVEIGRIRGVGLALLALVLTLAGLSALYYFGFLSSYRALDAKQWTASALAVGLLPVKGVVVLVPLLILAVLLARKERGKSVPTNRAGEV